jgi:hypothetical protein
LIRSRRVEPTPVLGTFTLRDQAIARARRTHLRSLIAWPLWVPLVESLAGRRSRDVASQLGASGEGASS